MSHISVLLHESIDALNLPAAIERAKSEGRKAVVVDCTLNGGGHSTAIAERFPHDVYLVGIDLDAQALERARQRLQATGVTFTLCHGSFRDIDKHLATAGFAKADAILADLGISSNQYDESGRGFSFLKDEPLVMTFAEAPGEHSRFSAFDLVNGWEEAAIADVIYAYGEERFARRIAKAIVEKREVKEIKTTFELVDIIRASVPVFYTKGRLHFATRTFQALRIAVNDELGALKDLVKKAIIALAPGGRLAIISFHSLEDRIVKQMANKAAEDELINKITKKPLIPTEDEQMANPRSRSAKLRIIEKIS